MMDKVKAKRSAGSKDAAYTLLLATRKVSDAAHKTLAAIDATRSAAAHKTLVATDAAWSATARLMTGAEWRRAVDRVKDPNVKIQTACIVWFDWFGSRRVSVRWADLDEYVAAWRSDQNAAKRDVKTALVAIGYPTHKAVERLAETERQSRSAQRKIDKATRGATQNCSLTEGVSFLLSERTEHRRYIRFLKDQLRNPEEVVA